MSKILIGHFDKHYRYELNRFFTSHKYIVAEADNSGALLSIAKLQIPEFIIVSDSLEGFSIDAFIRKLKENKLINTSIIILTKHDHVTYKLVLLELGVRKVLLDLATPTVLLAHVERIGNSSFVATYSKKIELSVESNASRGEKKTESQRFNAFARKPETTRILTSEPSMMQAANSSLLLRQATCQFCQSEYLVKLYTLKTRTILIEPDRFDVDCYVGPIGNNEYCDYSLLEVGVCQNCFFASTDFRLFDLRGLKTEETIFLSEYMHAAFMKKIGERRKLVSKCSDKMFTEHRTPEDALIAIQLAVHLQEFLFLYDKVKYALAQNEVFQLTLKAATIAAKAQLTEVRNKKYLHAYQLGLAQMALKGELGMRRHAMQMYALSYLLRQQDSMYKYGRELYSLLHRATTSPQIRIKTREYADRAKKYFAWVEDEKYWATRP